MTTVPIYVYTYKLFFGAEVELAPCSQCCLCDIGICHSWVGPECICRSNDIWLHLWLVSNPTTTQMYVMLKCCEILWNPVCNYSDWNVWKPKWMLFIAFPCCRFCIRPRSSPQSLKKATAVGRFRFDPGSWSGHRRSTWPCNWDLEKWNPAKPKPPLATCCRHQRGCICDLDEIGERRPDPTLHATGVREIPLQLVPVLDVPSSWKLCQIFVSLPNSWSSSVVTNTTCPGIGITLQRKCDVGLSAWSWHGIWQDLFRSLLNPSSFVMFQK